MIGFPFDSLVTYDEYGNPIFDRAVSSKPLKSLISKLFTTGVMPNPSDNFQVFAGTEGMTVVVHAGYAVIDGGLKLEENNRTLEIQASDSNYDRIDTVILRWNGNDNARVCDLYVLEGTPAPNPVRPELTRAGSIYEIGLADIIIPRNTGAISQQRITDTRYDSERCGIVSSVSEFDTTTLYAQVQADLASFKAEEQADFIVWYNDIKDRIDHITAETLQAQIDDINEPTITEASTRANIATGDTYSTILGKIKKWFTDIPNLFVSKSGDTMSGDLTIDKHSGTSGAVSTSDLILGNNIPQGTAGNSLGRIDIYGNGQYRERLYCDALTANRNVALPDKSGTIALISDFGWDNPVTVNLNSGTATYQKHKLLGLKRVTINSSSQPSTSAVLTGKIPSDYIPVISTLGTFYDNNGNPRNVLFYDSGNNGKMMINAGTNTGLVGEYLYW